LCFLVGQAPWATDSDPRSASGIMSCVWALNLKRANWHEVKWAAGGRKKLLRALQVAIALPAWNSIDMETNFGLVTRPLATLATLSLDSISDEFLIQFEFGKELLKTALADV